jgi:hypothetical protein
MTSLISRPRLLSAAFATLLGAAVIAGCSAGAARADDDTDGEEPTLLDTQILQYVLKGLGWRRGDQEKGIEYRERSPLVLPNSKDLPPPEKSQPAKSKVAGWPDDPDVKRAKKKKDDERKRKSYTEGVDDRPLLPSQVAKGADKIDPPQTILGSKNEEEATRPSSVWELGSKNIFSKVWGNNDDYTTFTGEPRRESLIEPPSGYRTPSPNQPFGVGKDRWVAPKVDRQEPVR